MLDKKKWKFSLERIHKCMYTHTHRETERQISDFGIFSNEEFYLTILRTVIISIPINSMAIFVWIFGLRDLCLREIDLNDEKNSKAFIHAFMCKLWNR